MNPLPLSKILHRIANNEKLGITTKMLPRIHHQNFNRLKALISSDALRSDEYMILRHFILHKSKNTSPRPYLIAVEYTFDDGGRDNLKGDAIMFDGNTIYIIECKITRGYQNRENQVISQAMRYMNKFVSWMKYLAETDDKMKCFNKVVAVVLKDPCSFEKVCEKIWS
jgi:hypothetical protein